MDDAPSPPIERVTPSRQGVLPGALRLGYSPPRGSWDEMFGADGLPRPHCEGFFSFLSTLTN